MLLGRLNGPFDTQKAQRQQGHGPDWSVGQPGVGAAQCEGHTSRGRDAATDPQAPEQEVRRPSGDHLEGELDQNQTLRESEQDGEREECTALHLAGQGRTQTLVRVPPRDVAVEPVENGQMSESLGGEPGIPVDIREAGQPPWLGRRQVGIEDEGIGGDQVQETQAVGHQNGAHDAGQRDKVR